MRIKDIYITVKQQSGFYIKNKKDRFTYIKEG